MGARRAPRWLYPVSRFRQAWTLVRFAAVLYSCIVAPLWLRSARSTYTHGVGLLEWLIDVLFVVNTLLHLVFPYYDTDAQQLVIDMAAIRDHALSTFELRINALASTPAVLGPLGYHGLLGLERHQVYWVIAPGRMGRVAMLAPSTQAVTQLMRRWQHARRRAASTSASKAADEAEPTAWADDSAEFAAVDEPHVNSLLVGSYCACSSTRLRARGAPGLVCAFVCVWLT